MSVVSSDADSDANPGANARATPFETLGGEAGVYALVGRFYDLMDSLPEFAALRALHPASLDNSRQRLFWFLCGWMGGPNHYVRNVGEPMLRARHLAVPIGVAQRDQWLDCMQRAMVGVGVDAALQVRLAQSFAGTADWMRNRAEAP